MAIGLILALVAGMDTARVVPNDNRVAAGRQRSGVLTVQLEAREGVLFPEREDGPGVPVWAFAEAGRAPSVPGPLLRVRAGTEVRATVRNRLPRALTIVGLQERPATHLDSIVIAPGASHEFRFRAGTPGTYFYMGRTTGSEAVVGRGRDGQLVGGFVIDPPDRAPDDRVMVLTLYEEDENAEFAEAGAARRGRVTFTVNGLAWPYTERLDYTVGDSVRWRVINASAAPHPMHLHGFYFRVDSRGALASDSTYTPEQQRLAVTEFLTAGTTMTMAWSPERAGNWLFHCHLIAHIAADLRLRPPGSQAHAAHGPHESAAVMQHAFDGMAGLVVGIRVRPARGAVDVAEEPPRRFLRGVVTQRDSVFGGTPGFSFLLQEGDREPAPDSVRIPGSMVTLVRGEPTQIVVRNRAREDVTLHWHGIELASYYDGVGGWSGNGAEVAPAIAPGDSFVVQLTPHRAGTFIYHTHMDEGSQLASGLYGALIVLEPGEPFDSTTERILLLGAGGPHGDAPALINGRPSPGTMDLVAGRTYRLRIINISASNPKVVQLLADSTVQRWRAFAKDGAYFPQWQRSVRPAQLRLGPGETYDFEFTPTARDYALAVTTLYRGRVTGVARMPIRAH